MKRLLAIFILVASAAFGQQIKNPVSGVLRDSLAVRQKNILAALQAMPADKYAFKPTPEQMSFGHLAVHIAESNYFFCANVGNAPQPKTEELKGDEDKAKLVDAVQASFDFCGAALAKADDATLGDTITGFDGKPRSRAWAFLALASSWADHYGEAAMYLRLNGLLPPTAQPRK